MITSNSIESELNEIETNLKQAIKASEKLYNDFNLSCDLGNLKDRAFLFVLAQNVENNKKALIDFYKLPLF